MLYRTCYCFNDAMMMMMMRMRMMMRMMMMMMIVCSYSHNGNYSLLLLYSVSQKNPHWGLLTFFQNGWKFLGQILHTYYPFLSTLDYKFLSSYLQFWRSYAILCATTQHAFQPMVDILSI